MGPTPLTSLHEPAATRPSEQAAYVFELGGAAYAEAMYQSVRAVSGRSFQSASLLIAPSRDENRHATSLGRSIIHRNVGAFFGDKRYYGRFYT